jgi:FkbM family methyltransferase
MIKSAIRLLADSAGYELRRRPHPGLPFLHTLRFDDGTFHVWIVNESTKSWWYRPHLEMHAEFSCLKKMCCKGGVAFDVGAHHGITSIPLARWLGPEGQVHSFEPNPDNAIVLQANLGVNKLNNCTCVHAAAGATDGSTWLDGEGIATAGSSRQKNRAVPVISLDSYREQHGIGRVDLIKIDVEGSEADVLQGARKTLEQFPHLALELHLDDLARYGTSAPRVLELIDSERYDIQMMLRPDWVTLYPFTSCQDLPATGVVNLFFFARGS